MSESVLNELNTICSMISDTVDVDKIYLFGSHAYGTPSEDSDYDLCVVIPDGSMRPIDAMKKIRRALYPIQTTPMDVLVYRSSRFLERQDAVTLERTIATKGVLLYEHT